jgi:pimeloyl-ACP methyl ester carboxylesterase
MQNTGTAADGALVPGGGRDFDALKAEVQRRADQDRPPLTGIDPEDARAALSSIRALDRDAWAAGWFAAGSRHWEKARALHERDPAAARAEYWRAWRLFHFARWPTENSPVRQRAKQCALEAFQAYARLLDPPMETLRIPFAGKWIVGYLRLPPQRPAPLVFAIAGLDSRKEDFAAHSDAYLGRGLALFTVDLPGTGESPLEAATIDADKVFSAALDHLERRPEIDAQRVVVQGRSWSGYWAAKLAVSERRRLRGTVMHGGPIHLYFQPDWLRSSLATGEYLYDYLAAKNALVGASNFDEMVERMRPFSLLDAGVLDQPSTAMLCVNGARDSQIPIADLYLLLEHGDPKDAWINPAGGHMGRSPQWPSSAIAAQVVMPWVARRLGLPQAGAGGAHAADTATR